MIVFIQADGTAITVAPSPVYQGSSLSGSLYFVAPFPPANSVSVAFQLADGKNTERYPLTSIAELEGVTDKLGDEYSIWEWQMQNAFVTAKAGTVTAQFAVVYNGQTVTTTAVDFVVQKGVIPLSPPKPTQDQWDTIIELYGNLSGRIADLEDFTLKYAPVVSIQNDSPNSFTYTNSKGLTSAPIVIECGGGGSGLSTNEASTLFIPQTAWQAVSASDETKGFKCVINAAMHGQMRNGATARDLWVSFGESANKEISGVIESYVVGETGDITVTVKQKVDLIVRVWNGKGVAAIVKWGVNAPTKLSTIEWITIGGK